MQPVINVTISPSFMLKIKRPHYVHNPHFNMICANLGGAVGGTFGNWRLNSSKLASGGDSSSWKSVKNVAVVLVITLKCIH